MKADVRLPPQVSVRSIERASFDEVFITVGSPRGVGLEDAGEVFSAVAATAAKLGLGAIGEKIYGSLDAREQLLARRAAVASSLGPIPSTFIEGRCIDHEESGAVLAGV